MNAVSRKFRNIFSLALALTLASLATPTFADEVVKVNINTATATELATLPRIGPKVAERVIEYREQNGGFRSVDELMQVRGIGPKVLENLQELVTVGDPPSAPTVAESKAAGTK